MTAWPSARESDPSDPGGEYRWRVFPQLHVYVTDAIAKEARRLAEAEGLSVSKFLAQLLERELGAGWPDDYFDRVVGSWQGDRLERAPQGDAPDREALVGR